MRSILLAALLATTSASPLFAEDAPPAPFTPEELAAIKQGPLHDRDRDREQAYARCRLAAYEASASDITDYAIACMIAGGWSIIKNVDDAATPAEAFEWYCMSDWMTQPVREGWCGS